MSLRSGDAGSDFNRVFTVLLKSESAKTLCFTVFCDLQDEKSENAFFGC